MSKSENIELERDVLQEIADERLEWTKKGLKHNADFRALQVEWAPKLDPLISKLGEAISDQKRVQRFKGKVSEQEFQSLASPAEKAVNAARGELGAMQRAFDEYASVLNRNGKALNDRLVALAGEWDSAVRRARHLGIDVSGYWTPDQLIPPEPGAVSKPADATAETLPPAPEAESVPVAAITPEA